MQQKRKQKQLDRTRHQGKQEKRNAEDTQKRRRQEKGREEKYRNEKEWRAEGRKKGGQRKEREGRGWVGKITKWGGKGRQRLITQRKQNRKKRMYSFEVDISVFQGKGIAEER